MGRTFSFRGLATRVDLSSIVHGSDAFTRARRRMVEELGMSEQRANRILEDMLGQALLRHGDHLIRGKSNLIDRVIDLRDRLDTLYGSLLDFRRRDGTGGRVDYEVTGSVDAQIRELDTLYRDLDAALDDLAGPLDEIAPPHDVAEHIPQHLRDEIAGTTPLTRTQTERDVTQDLDAQTTTRRDGTTSTRRARIEGGRYRFTRNADGSYTKTFADGATATFHVRDGRYRVETFDPSGRKTLEFGEYDILHDAYARRPRTTALMQAHHGMQNSLMTRLFRQFGYDGGAAPTVWLRNSRRGSPHGSITAVQNGQKSTRSAAGRTYSDIRSDAIADLLLTDMPQPRIAEYLAAFDHYFASNVLPNIPEADYARLLGDWRPQ